MKSAAVSETAVMNVGLISGPEQDSNSIVHFLLMPICVSENVGYRLHELLDKECLRLLQVKGIDIQHGAKCGSLTLHIQHDVLRHHFSMHLSRLDTSVKVREEVQEIARARGAADRADRCCERQLRQGQR